MHKVYLKPGKEESLKRFHPWIFSGAISRFDGEPDEGEVVEVYTSKKEFIAEGHFQIGSIAVRVLSFQQEPINHDFWKRKLEIAYDMRDVYKRQRQFFIDHIFDFRKGGEFVSKSDKPIVIDFWATWCGPCMRLRPQMEKMAEQYKGKVMFYKVNADKEKDLCNHFGVQALPTLFFIPAGGKPIIEVGATPEKYVQIIEEQLLK